MAVVHVHLLNLIAGVSNMKKLILLSIICILFGCGSDTNPAQPKQLCHQETYCAEYGNNWHPKQCTREVVKEVCEDIKY